jgi:uncharacterized protein DUF3291
LLSSAIGRRSSAAEAGYLANSSILLSSHGTPMELGRNGLQKLDVKLTKQLNANARVWCWLEAEMDTYRIAQVNIGRMRAPLDDPFMAGFVARLDEINALADRSAGFVWRLQASEGNAAYLRPYDDDRILINMSVWETVEHLKHFVYRSMHVELVRQRADWFEKFNGAYSALWWVPAAHVPSVDEAKKRLEYLERNGPTEFSFTFQKLFTPSEEFQRGIDWSSFLPCPAM